MIMWLDKFSLVANTNQFPQTIRANLGGDNLGGCVMMYEQMYHIMVKQDVKGAGYNSIGAPSTCAYG